MNSFGDREVSVSPPGMERSRKASPGPRGLFLATVLVMAMLMISCGNEGGGLILTPRVLLSIDPTNVVMLAGGTQQFNATILGTRNHSVTWTVNDIAGGNATVGTISPTGLYSSLASAPSGIVTIRATSQADSAATATATQAVVSSGAVTATNNPQVAMYSINSPLAGTVTVEFGPDTFYGLRTWSRNIPASGGQVDIFVAGMRAFTTYHMRAIVDFPGGFQLLDSDHTFTTGGLPPDRLPQFTVTRPSDLTPSPGIERISLISPSTSPNLIQAAVTDLEGNVIWYYETPENRPPLPFKLLENGNMLFQVQELLEVNLAGNIVRQLTREELNTRLADAGFNLTINPFHHDILALPNGHFIILASRNKDFVDLPGYPGTTSVNGDVLIDVDESLQPVWVWDAFDHLDVNRHPMQFPDWTHSNAVVYSPDDGDLLLSVRHQHWVLKLDYRDGQGTGDIIWRLGYEGDFALQDGGPADWFFGQHFPIFLSPNSTNIFQLGIFDNGNDRVLDEAGTICDTQGALPCYSRAPIFEVNETLMTARVLWEGKRDEYSFALGSMQVLGNGNVEFDLGIISTNPRSARVVEVTQEAIPQTVWQLDVDGQFVYRAIRIPSLYPGVQW